MAQDNGLNRLKTALVLFIMVDIFYGIVFFITPGIASAIAGGAPVENGWIRWSGGILLGLAVGGISAYRDPSHQRAMITALTATALLSGLAHAYALLFETYSMQTWVILLSCVVSFVGFGVMLWARQGAKDILA